MQIHELTQRNITEASIADRIKSAATAVKTGIQNIPGKIAQSDVVQQNIKPVAQTVQQGDAWDPVAYAKNKQAATQAMAAKYAQKLQAKGYGTAATAPAAGTQPAQQPAPEPSMILGPDGKPLNSTATQQPAAAATTTQPAGPVNTNRLQAQAVATGQAGAVMTTPDFNAAIRQLTPALTPAHIDSLKDSFAKNASFATAFLKATGLKK